MKPDYEAAEDIAAQLLAQIAHLSPSGKQATMLALCYSAGLICSTAEDGSSLGGNLEPTAYAQLYLDAYQAGLSQEEGLSRRALPKEAVN